MGVRKSAIPSITGQTQELQRILEPMKAAIETITGARSGMDPITALPADGTGYADIVGKVNEICARLNVTGTADTGTNSGATGKIVGNIGIGAKPISSWAAGRYVLQLGPSGAVWADDVAIVMSNAGYYDGTNWKYITGAAVTDYYQYNGEHVWRTAPAGSAGGIPSLTEKLKLQNNGDLLSDQSGTGYPKAKYGGSRGMTILPTTDPTYSASWARGVFYDKWSDGTTFAGFGMLGANESAGSFHVALNTATWWSNANLMLTTSGLTIRGSTQGTVEAVSMATGSYARLVSWDAGGGLRPTSLSVSNDGSAASEIVRLSSAGAHWIKFAASQNASGDANALDDYEEGTWGPVTATANVAITNNGSYYVKIGQFVHAYCYVGVQNNTGGTLTNFGISGLPFSSLSYGGGSCQYDPAVLKPYTCYPESAANYFIINLQSGLPNGSSTGLMFTLSYRSSTG